MGGGASICGNSHVSKTVTCRSWVGSSTDGSLVFPEAGAGDFGIPSLQAKPDFAICMSGGGMRAASTALGFARGLQGLGVLSKARYLASTSGGSWFNGPLCFGKYDSLEGFLGPYIAPEDLSLSRLKDVGEPNLSYMGCLADSNSMLTFVGEILQGVVSSSWDKNKSQAWTDMVAKSFLQPFGLGSTSDNTATAIGTRGSVHTRIGSVAQGLQYTVYSSSKLHLPFPVITQCILIPNDDRKFFPAEWTPLYAGVPVLLTDTSDNAKYGGGWVEPIGLNARLILPPPSGGKSGPESGYEVKMELLGPASLAEAISISSGCVPFLLELGTDKKGQVLNKLLGTSTSQYTNQQDWTHKEVEWADGGGTDLLGMHPLLRRKVKKIVSWLACSRDPIDEAAWQSGSGACVDLCFGVYNGPERSKKPNALNNRLLKVFSTSGGEHAALWADVQSKFAAGGPIWHRAKYTVVENSFLGVPGGWEVEVLWIFNSTCPRWEAALPSETKQHLADQRSSGKNIPPIAALQPFVPADLSFFPVLSTMCMAYSKELIVMMTNQTAWIINQLREQILEMAA